MHEMVAANSKVIGRLVSRANVVLEYDSFTVTIVQNDRRNISLTCSVSPEDRGLEPSEAAEEFLRIEGHLKSLRGRTFSSHLLGEDEWWWWSWGRVEVEGGVRCIMQVQ